MLKLSDISNDQQVKVVALPSSEFHLKLMEMGIFPGKVLTVLYRAPFGDPIAVDIEGYVLSLRKEEAALIQVEKTGPNQ